MRKNAAEYVAKKFQNQNNDTAIKERQNITVASASEKQPGKRSKNDDHKNSRTTPKTDSNDTAKQTIKFQ